MTPFPEAEDMTIKRLYVALKRGDMQLLQLGAHKLHEKFHTGYKFELTDDLRQILSYIEEQSVPNDIKDLLTRTINDILNGEKPEIVYENSQQNFEPKDLTEKKEPIEIIKDAFNPAKESILSVQQTIFETNEQDTTDETLKPDVIMPYGISNTEEKIEDNFVQDENTIENNIEEKPVIFTPQQQEQPQEQIQEEIQEQHHEKEQMQEQEGQEIEQLNSNEENKESKNNYIDSNEEKIILEQKESTLQNVAVFYDDKPAFVDYMKNKAYRLKLDKLSLNEESYPMEDCAVVKNIADIQTDEIGEILKMLNTTKGDIYFITTSKSENIIKTFIQYDVNFEIPNITKQEYIGKTTKIIPLFGLSNIFVCPKCGQREYFGGLHNKVLSMQCNKCSSSMYPDIYEAQNLETNASPYYFIKGIDLMKKADTWILINPPLENNRALTVEFLRCAFEVSRPKKVYILSKEITKKEYYKQMFKEIDENCIVKYDYITQDSLCEDFINNEISTIKVSV